MDKPIQGTMFCVVDPGSKKGDETVQAVFELTPAGKIVLISCYRQFLSITAKDNPHIGMVKKRIKELEAKGGRNV